MFIQNGTKPKLSAHNVHVHKSNVRATWNEIKERQKSYQIWNLVWPIDYAKRIQMELPLLRTCPTACPPARSHKSAQQAAIVWQLHTYTSHLWKKWAVKRRHIIILCTTLTCNRYGHPLPRSNWWPERMWIQARNLSNRSRRRLWSRNGLRSGIWARDPRAWMRSATSPDLSWYAPPFGGICLCSAHHPST